MFGLFKSHQTSNDASLLKQALSPDVAVVVSASCCMQGTADTDREVEAVVRRSLDKAHLDWPVLTITVTQAQNALGKVSGELNQNQARIAQEVSELFLSTGLSAFPILIINQRIISFGGVPGDELVTQALQQKSQVSHENVT